MSQLECKNLTLGYGTKTVIENLSFSVNKGDYLCIVGENGSGKTTLMKTILRLLKPLSGTISTGDGLLPDEISYLPQQTEVQRDFPASVREIVLSGCQSRCGRRPFYNKAEKQLEKLKSSETYINITGVQYYQNFEPFKEGTIVDLIKEPDNPHDLNAIRVEIKGKTVGYVANNQYTLIKEVKSARNLKHYKSTRAEVQFILFNQWVIAKLI